jgi:hypothetical protein
MAEDPRAFLAEYMGQLIKQRKGDADAQGACGVCV